MKKHRAPSAVHQFAVARSSIEPVDGRTNEARAETPNSTHPSRFTATVPRPVHPPRQEAWSGRDSVGQRAGHEKAC